MPQTTQDKRGVWFFNGGKWGPTVAKFSFLSDPDYIFNDDFSGVKDTSFWEGGGVKVEYGADNPSGSGKCLLFSALASDGANDGYNWTEQRFQLPIDAVQVEIEYDIWVSPGFEMQPGGTSHQKFLLLWSGEYGTAASNCSINCEVWPNYKIGFNWGEDGNNYGHAIPSGSEQFLTPGGGYWMKVHFLISLAESEGEKGRIVMLKNDTVYSDTATTEYEEHVWVDQPSYSSRGNFLSNGYLMGWQNQPYLVDTFFAVRNFELRANSVHKSVNYGPMGE